MMTVILCVYLLGIILAGIGVLKYRSKVKNSNSDVLQIKAENSGMPSNEGLKHIKIICR